jgi:hypothetical protein
MSNQPEMPLPPCGEGGLSRLRAWSLAGALGGLSLMAALALSLQPPASGPVALVFPPWWSMMRSVVSAATIGSVVRLGAVPFIVVVQPDRRGPRGRLPSTAAWLVLDPRALGGCGYLPRKPE